MGFVKNKKHYVFFLVLGAFLIINVPVAQAGWFDFFFRPSIRNNEDLKPSQTLLAPFADQDAVIEEFDPTGNFELAVPLDQRHRPNAEISKWVQQIVPTVLTYNSDNYEKEYVEIIKNFSKVGAKEFVKFLQERNIVKTLRTGRYNVTGIVQGYPVIINERALEGRYRWLVQVEVLVTYIDNRVKRIKDAKEGDMITQELVLTLQLGRVRGVDNPHGLLIETWTVKNAN
jgi:hypothetical protein